MVTPMQLLLNDYQAHDAINEGKAFANSNIALIKYWGKRDADLNLPITDSLSIHLPGLGTEASVRILDGDCHQISIDGFALGTDHAAFKGLNNYLTAISDITKHHYHLSLRFTIPVAAGFASSASCFASIALACNDLHQWNLSTKNLSIMARLGSGSACRSIEAGFCHWHAGESDNGLDSYATQLDLTWPELCIGLLHIDNTPKPYSSRLAMSHTQKTSFLYQAWPTQVAHDLKVVQQAINTHDFQALGETAEHNAESMHACMSSAKPALFYSQGNTLAAKAQVFKAREQGIPMYYTQDAGPNLKCLFLQHDLDAVLDVFPNLQVIQPFGDAGE